ncbi:MAG: metal ABC transporter ATP-binding protein [Microgenomates group bacterium]|nr:metal ABC transporter ATP-binding protein [Microgenomates group bacterium]
MDKILLEVKNLTVVLDGEKIINNLSFSINQGETLTILGPNGAGKSVLLRTLLGLIPYQGKINWNKKIKIGYLPQGLTQLSTKNQPLTVEDFFNLNITTLSKKEIIHFLKLVGLSEEILVKLIGNLSSGQFQRMLIAWVLIGKPEIIFLDEPTTGIDLGGGETIYSLLQKIKNERGLTIFLVTHDLNIVYGFSDKVLCLTRRGHRCFGSPKMVLTPQSMSEVFGMNVKFYKHQ